MIPANRNIAQALEWTNQNSEQIHIAEAKRGKTFASESRLLLTWFYFWLDNKVAPVFFKTNRLACYIVKQKQSKREFYYMTRSVSRPRLFLRVYDWPQLGSRSTNRQQRTWPISRHLDSTLGQWRFWPLLTLVWQTKNNSLWLMIFVEVNLFPDFCVLR